MAIPIIYLISHTDLSAIKKVEVRSTFLLQLN